MSQIAYFIIYFSLGVWIGFAIGKAYDKHQRIKKLKKILEDMEENDL